MGSQTKRVYYRHACPDWGGLFICELDDEFGRCGCFKDDMRAHTIKKEINNKLQKLHAILQKDT